MNNDLPHFVYAQSNCENANIYLQNIIAQNSNWGNSDNINLPKKVFLIGAGLMGCGIAYAFARKNIKIFVYDKNEQQLDKAKDIFKKYDARENSFFSQNIYLTHDVNNAEDCDLLIEAVYEDIELKRKIFAQFDAFVNKGAIFATNTSTLDIDYIAKATKRESQIIGTHFFLPAHVTNLLEIIPNKLTSQNTIKTILKIAKHIGKEGVIAGNCDGFIGNRLFDRLHQEAMYLIEEGASPSQIDKCLENWGFAIGPFRVLDMIDNRLVYKSRQNRKIKNNTIKQPLIGDILVEAGHFGKVNNKGWYIYEENMPICNNPIIEDLRSQLNYRNLETTFKINDENILLRCLIALTNEGIAIFNEGYAKNYSDIDIIYCLGYGFPKKFGGPLFFMSSLNEEELFEFSQKLEKQINFGKSRILNINDLKKIKKLQEVTRETDNAARFI